MFKGSKTNIKKETTNLLYSLSFSLLLLTEQVWELAKILHIAQEDYKEIPDMHWRVITFNISKRYFQQLNTCLNIVSPTFLIAMAQSQIRTPSFLIDV